MYPLTRLAALMSRILLLTRSNVERPRCQSRRQICTKDGATDFDHH